MRSHPNPYTAFLALSDAYISAVLRNSRPPKFSDDDKRYRYFHAPFEYFEAELKKTGVTWRLFWVEYLSNCPDGYRYTLFCHFLSERDKRNGAVMRLVHLPSEELQVDLAGD